MKRTLIVETSQEVLGRVTFAQGCHVEITVGKSPKPEFKVYSDGNPLNLHEGEEVIVSVKRAR